jgi:hypothetical protein
MLRDIVVFERDGRNTRTGQPELGFRLIRGALPMGSSPLAIADHHGFTVACGQWFDKNQVRAYAEQQSGYRAEQ